jgi:hypothetical protein
VWGHTTANLWLLADYHALQDERFTKREIACDCSVFLGEGHALEGRGKIVESMAYLVDGKGLRFKESAL